MSCNCANCREPMPDVPFIGKEESARRRAHWEATRQGAGRSAADVKGAGLPKFDPASPRK